VSSLFSGHPGSVVVVVVVTAVVVVFVVQLYRGKLSSLSRFGLYYLLCGCWTSSLVVVVTVVVILLLFTMQCRSHQFSLTCLIFTVIYWTSTLHCVP